MTPSKLLLPLLSLLLASACDLNHDTYAVSKNNFRIPTENVRREIMSLRDVPGYDEKGQTLWLTIEAAKITNKAGQRLLQGVVNAPEFQFEVDALVGNGIKYIPKTPAQMTKEYIENVDEGEDIVFDVKDVIVPDTTKRPTLILDKQNNISSICLFGYEKPVDVKCSNYVADDGFVVRYEAPLGFVRNADRKKELDDFLRNLLRSWKVKA